MKRKSQKKPEEKNTLTTTEELDQQFMSHQKPCKRNQANKKYLLTLDKIFKVLREKKKINKNYISKEIMNQNEAEINTFLNKQN